MGHSSVIQNQFVVVFGGLNNGESGPSMITSDLYVLSLDGSLSSILPSDKPKKKNTVEQQAEPSLVNQDTFVRSLL